MSGLKNKPVFLFKYVNLNTQRNRPKVQGIWCRVHPASKEHPKPKLRVNRASSLGGGENDCIILIHTKLCACMNTQRHTHWNSV